jgi:hypothetical protein
MEEKVFEVNGIEHGESAAGSIIFGNSKLSY